MKHATRIFAPLLFFGAAIASGVAVLPKSAANEDLSNFEGVYAFAPELCNLDPSTRIDLGPRKLLDHSKVLKSPELQFEKIEKHTIQHQLLGLTDYYFAYSRTSADKVLVSVFFRIPDEFATIEQIGIQVQNGTETLAYSAYEFQQTPSTDEILDALEKQVPKDSNALFRCNLQLPPLA
jgi:hypothetical protein